MKRRKINRKGARQMYTSTRLHPCNMMLHDCDEQQASYDDVCVRVLADGKPCGFTAAQHHEYYRKQRQR